MILLVDTSTAVCRVTLIEGGARYDSEWNANRELAKNFLKYLRDKLAEKGKGFSDIEAIGVFEGPGSFTGLRIGLTVLNTMADANNIPIIGARGENWQEIALSKIKAGENHKIVLPFYGAEAKITTSKK